MVKEYEDETRLNENNSPGSASEPDGVEREPGETTGTEEDKVDGEDLSARLEAAEQEIAEYKMRLTRLQADFINFRRRTERERTEQIKFANGELLHKLLPILDNLERAVKAGSSSDTAEPLLEGVNQVLKQFIALLEQEGVTPLDPGIGQPFEPEHQEALICAEGEAEVVVEELLRGWRYHDRILRPTLVKVGPRSHLADDDNVKVDGPAADVCTADRADTKEVRE